MSARASATCATEALDMAKRPAYFQCHDGRGAAKKKLVVDEYGTPLEVIIPYEQ